MEMIIANRFRTNDLVLVPTNGKFGERVAEMGSRFCNVKHLKYDWGRAFDLGEIEEQLARGNWEAVAICHNETSTGIAQDAIEIAEMCERNGVALPYDIIEFIATHMRTNIRDLEGTIIRLLARSSLMNQDIDHDLVRDVVKERVGKKPNRELSMEDVVRKVSELSGISEQGIVGKSRKQEIVEARQTAMFLCRQICSSRNCST